MRLCVSLGTPSLDGSENADIIEIRTDVFSHIPTTDKETIITLTDPIHVEMIPENFTGMVDIGLGSASNNFKKTITSYHDPDRIPNDALTVLRNMNGDIVKGAFRVRDLRDLVTIFNISSELERKHVIIGMGELGKITRIRQDLLNNEFTFCHTGTPTAPGQMSLEDMRCLGDHPVLTGLVGDGLSNTSQVMHDTAFEKLGIRGKYLLFDVRNIDGIEEVIRSYQIRGLNVTRPFKTDMISHLDRLEHDAEIIGAVNTIVNDNGKLEGYNTDVRGIDASMEIAGFDPSGKRALVIGSGGAARACTFTLIRSGCEVTVVGRNPDSVASLTKEFGCRSVPYGSASVKLYDIVVNCTPEADLKIGLDGITSNQIIFDMIHYSDTSLLDIGRARGCTIVDAKDMLAAQGAASFELWKDVHPFNIMRDAI